MGLFNGTVKGTPTFGTAKFSNGLISVSDSNYIELPNSLFQFAGAWTIEGWIKDGPSSISVAVGSHGAAGQYAIWIGTLASGNIAGSFVPTYSTAGVVLDSTVSCTDGLWHHVALVYSGSAVKLYVDGVAKATSSKTPRVPQLNISYVGAIGKFPGSQIDLAFPGDIDEVAFWDSAKYTADFTPATAAYTGNEENARALYHLESDGTDSVTAINVGTPSFDEYGPAKLDFHWAEATGGTAPYSYQVQRAPDSGGVPGTFADIGTAQSGLTYSDTAVNAGTKYHYRVVATDSLDNSRWGNSASKTTLAAGIKYNRRDMTSSILAKDVMVLIPNSNAAKPYNPTIATPLLMYHHGSGEDAQALLDDTLKANVTIALIDAGYICCGIAAAGNNWGNQAGCDCYPDLYYTVDNYYNLSYTLFLGQSMGGLTSLLCLSQNVVPKVIAWAGIYPACNLGAIYSAGTFAAAINTAYSCTSATYATKTYGHDPCLKWGKAFRNVPMRFYASESDTVIVKDTNTDTFQPIISSSCTESTIVLCTGDHGDPSHFQPADLVAFYERALANPVATSGLGSGGKVSITSFNAEVSL